jgi:hypothetical protein
MIPTGTNFKATMMIEYPSPAIRHRMLQELVNIENRVYVQVEGSDRVYAQADEDLDRATQIKTSAVHFLRFELTLEDRLKLHAGAALAIGIDHDKYTTHISEVDDNFRLLLMQDLEI